MDLTLPYTFYPLALPHWMAWGLFLLAMLGGAAVGVARGRGRGWLIGMRAAMLGAGALLVVTMVASMVITFLAALMLGLLVAQLAILLSSARIEGVTVGDSAPAIARGAFRFWLLVIGVSFGAHMLERLQP